MAASDVSPSPSLRLAMAAAWWTLRGRDITGSGRGHTGSGPARTGRGPARTGSGSVRTGSGPARTGSRWARLLALLEAAGGGAPGLLRPRHRLRLSLGIRAQVVTSLLQELGPSPAVLDALDWLFPEGAGPGSGHGLGTLQGRPLVAVAEESFREQVLGIVGTGRGLEQFLQEYGPRFRNSLRNLFLEFLRRLESALPPPDLAQLEQLCLSHAPPGCRPRPLPILRLYWSEVGHAHPVPVPRPLPAEKATPTKLRRRLRPLRFSPYRE